MKMSKQTSLLLGGVIALAGPLSAEAQQYYYDCDVADFSCGSAVGYSTAALGDYSTAAGRESVASGEGAVAMGYQSTASGDYSVSMGYMNNATQTGATAMGRACKASGTGATAIGVSTQAKGDYSMAMGYITVANGLSSTAMGFMTKADAVASLAIGRYNVGGGSGDSWVSEDPVFEIGNGSSSTDRHNAFTVLKNGYTGINMRYPGVPLHITGGSDVKVGSGGMLVFGHMDGYNIAIDSNEIMARSNGQTSRLSLQADGGNVYVGGDLVHSSDRRLKEDIEDLSYGLDEVCLLHPVSYYWQGRETPHASIGLIAQDVREVMEEMVFPSDGEKGMLAVDYLALTTVMINAVQALDERNRIVEQRLKQRSNEIDARVKQHQRLDAQHSVLGRLLTDQARAFDIQAAALADLVAENNALAEQYDAQTSTLAALQQQLEAQRRLLAALQSEQSAQLAALPQPFWRTR